MTWRAYLARTMTGDIGVELPWTSGSVTQTLNDHDQIDLVTSVGALDGVEESWWSEGSGSLVVTYEDGFGVERVISAGPISDPPKDDRAAQTITFSATGVSAILESRVALDKEYTPGDQIGLRTSKLVYKDQSFRSIMGDLVRRGLQKRQGYLPIVTPPTESGAQARTFGGYDVANNIVWSRVTELAEAGGGPDFMFRPRWVGDDHTRIEWEMVVGSDAQRTLPQDNEVLWDGTSRSGAVATLDLAYGTEPYIHRAYATGAGSGSTVALDMAESATLGEYVPLLEGVVTASSADTTGAGRMMLSDVARGALNSRRTNQVSAGVYADPKLAPIGTWWCGELALLATEGWRTYPNGEFRLLAISVKYTLGSDMVDIEFQEDYLEDIS